MNDPEIWRWIWLVAALGFGLGEMLTPGAFFMAPFGIGAAGAALVSFLGAPIGVGWLLFVIVSIVSFLALRPLSRRFDSGSPNPLGVGASRLLGEQGIVLDPVPAGPDELGLVRLGREEWRAQSLDGSSIAQGTPVTVLEVKGTRVVVFPSGLPIPNQPPERSI